MSSLSLPQNSSWLTGNEINYQLLLPYQPMFYKKKIRGLLEFGTAVLFFPILHGPITLSGPWCIAPITLSSKCFKVERFQSMHSHLFNKFANWIFVTPLLINQGNYNANIGQCSWKPESVVTAHAFLPKFKAGRKRVLLSPSLLGRDLTTCSSWCSAAWIWPTSAQWQAAGCSK